jgi:hypothetical protein
LKIYTFLAEFEQEKSSNAAIIGITSILSFITWWSVRGSKFYAISEHVEMKGGQHAITFHPTTHPTINHSSTNLNFSPI